MQKAFLKKSLNLFLALPRKVVGWAIEQKFGWTDLIVLAVYGVIVSFGVSHHESWSDEAYPWMIARDADWRTFWEILFTNRDRHPGLFYIALLPLARCGLPYITQGFLNAAFAVGAAFLLLFRGPFPRVFRYLFLASFFMLYEYAVITRTYMMSVLIIFSIAALYPKRTERSLLFAFLLAMLFQVDFMCLGLGIGLTAVFAWEHRNKFAGNRALIFAMILMVLAAGVTLWVVHDLPLDHPDRGVHLPFSLRQCVVPVSKAFLPFFNETPIPWIPILSAIGSFVALFLSGVAILRKPAALLILGCALAPLFYLFNFVNVGDYRHYGFILVSVVFTLWIAEAYPVSRVAWTADWLRMARAAAIALMCVFFILGFKNVVFIYLMEYRRPFSGSQETAKALDFLDKRFAIFKQGFTVVAKNARSISLMPYLPGVKFWNPCTGSFARYYYNTKTLAACEDVSPYEAILRTRVAWGGDISRALFLFETPVPLHEDADYVYKNFFTSKKGFGYTQETFYLYRAIPKAPPPGAAKA